LSKAYEMLETGKVSEITWYPPFYRILLAEFIVFTGANNAEQALFLIKTLTSIIDWLLIFSVYLLGTRLLKEECGIIASFLMLLCFPLYEINFWGGYPSLLSIVYVCLLLFYLPSKREGFAHKLVIFLIAFSIVLTHQFTTFLTLSILILYALILLILRRSLNRLLIIAILGVSTAFILWYIPVVLPYLDILITHVFFSERQYLYLVKRVSLDVFLLNFGFIFLFAFFGALLTFYTCKKKKELDFYTLLCLTFFVPLAFTQSYLLNILLPYDRFVYYLMPPAVVFAAAINYLLVKFAVSNALSISRKNLKFYLKTILTMSIIILLIASRFPVLTSKISEATEYYSYIDLSGYQAGLWLKNNYPCKSTVLVTEKPGVFFGLFSDKFTIMETNPIIERADVAETVLNLAYEMENPITLFRVYEARMPYELDQYNVLVHNIWKRSLFLYDEETSLSYVENGMKFSANLSDLNRKIFWIEENNCKNLQIQYSLKGKFNLTESVNMKDDNLPVSVTWTFTSLSKEIKDLNINLSIHFDLYLSFEKAYVPGLLDWESPWNKSSFVEENGRWALVDLPKNLTKNYVAVYDHLSNIFCAIKLVDAPKWGSMGVLQTGQIDALRLSYKFERLDYKASFTYWVLTFSEESFQSVNLSDFEKFFDLKVNFNVRYGDYLTYAKEFRIQFVVFDVKKFRSEFLNVDFLQLIYSDSEYVICKIKGISYG